MNYEPLHYYDPHHPTCPNCQSDRHLYRKVTHQYIPESLIWTTLDDEEVLCECTDCDCLFDLPTGKITNGGELS